MLGSVSRATISTPSASFSTTTGRPWGVAVSPDGRVVATAGGDWSIRIWDRETGEQQAVLLGHQGRVRAVAFDPQGRYIASAGDDGEVRMWDASRWRSHR